MFSKVLSRNILVTITLACVAFSDFNTQALAANFPEYLPTDGGLRKFLEASSQPDPSGHPVNLVAPVIRVDARDYPFSAIGRLNLGGNGYCNAVLVGPDLVLSAANCLYNHIDGRWFGAKELFFQTAYQFEKAGYQTGIIAYAAPKSYRPGKRLTLASIRVDFVFLKLEQPIGNYTGWLGLRWNDDTLERRRRSRQLMVHHVGYARKRQHLQVVDVSCNVVAATCVLARQRVTLRPIVEHNGEFYAVPLRTKVRAGGRIGLRRIATRLLKRLGYDGIETPAPKTGKRKPTSTIVLLLKALGYLPEQTAHLSASQLARGIWAYQRDNGHLPDGKISLQLLANMLRAVHSHGYSISRSRRLLVPIRHEYQGTLTEIFMSKAVYDEGIWSVSSLSNSLADL